MSTFFFNSNPSKLLNIVGTNIALGRQTVQSSTFAPGDRATDGCLDTNYFNGCCSHTNIEQSPWLGVDLGHTYLIRKVRLLNRGDNRCRWKNIHEGNKVVGKNGGGGGQSV